MSSASYRKFTYLIAVGATQVINRMGDFFHVIAADQPFAVAWDDDAPTPFFAGLEYEVPDGQSFSKALITNTGNAPLSIELGIGFGGVRDGRFTVSSTLDVADNGGASFGEVVAAIQAQSNTDIIVALENTVRGRATEWRYIREKNVTGPNPTNLVSANPLRKEIHLVNRTSVEVHIISSLTGVGYLIMAPGSRLELAAQNQLWVRFVPQPFPTGGAQVSSGQYVDVSEVVYV